MTRPQIILIAAFSLTCSSMAFAVPPDDALCRAAANGDNPRVTKLIRAGMNADALGDEDQPPLAYAAEHGHLDTMKLLPREGAKLSACSGSNLLDPNGELSNKALDGAADGTYIGIVEFLMRKGLKINIQDCNGYTPLLRAASAGSGPTVRYLLRAGANPNVETRHFGWSALMLAARANSVTSVRALLRYKANFTLDDKDDHTALYYARQGHHQLIVSLLRSAGDKR